MNYKVDRLSFMSFIFSVTSSKSKPTTTEKGENSQLRSYQLQINLIKDGANKRGEYLDN